MDQLLTILDAVRNWCTPGQAVEVIKALAQLGLVGITMLAVLGLLGFRF